MRDGFVVFIVNPHTRVKDSVSKESIPFAGYEFVRDQSNDASTKAAFALMGEKAEKTKFLSLFSLNGTSVGHQDSESMHGTRRG